jgi:N utilization substance protein A
MERLRQSASRPPRTRTEPLTERERLMFVRGIGERTVQLLEEAGYKTVEDVLREDEDRLAIRSGLGIKKAAPSSSAAKEFVESEQKVLDAAREQKNEGS